MPLPQSPAEIHLSVIIPLLNEEEVLPILIAELRQALAAIPQRYEVILIDDGSTDGTPRELARIAEEWPECRVMRFPKNRGQAAALLAGMRAARGELLATMDGDGQNDPADIPRLLGSLDGADMVAGVRRRRRDSLLRRLMSRVANRVRRWFLQDGVSDTGCGLKVFRRDVVEAFIPIRTLYSFMPALAAAAGFRIAELPVNHRARLGGRSSYGLGVMLWRPFIDMLGIWWFARRRIPEGGL